MKNCQDQDEEDQEGEVRQEKTKGKELKTKVKISSASSSNANRNSEGSLNGVETTDQDGEKKAQPPSGMKSSTQSIPSSSEKKE